MIKSILYISIIVFTIGCLSRTDTNSARNSDATKLFQLRVNPEPGSKYEYGISNETKMFLEVDGKEIETTNKSTIESNYDISEDSIGKLLLTLKFNKIYIFSKTGDKIKEMNSDNAYSFDPSEKLLSVLKETRFQSSLDTNGEIKILSGFKDISDKIIAAYPATDPATRSALVTQWNKIIGEQFVSQNTSQLFQRFPDTPVFVGSVWRYSTTQPGQLPVTVDNLFTVKSISPDITVITCTGTITNSNGQTSISGIGENIKANLKGEQQSEYEIETKTGMVINNQVKANFEGSIQVMGRDIPVIIKSSIKVTGKRS